MKSVTEFVSDYEYKSTNEHGNTVFIDMYPAGEKKHQSPMDLVLSAVASCSAVDVVQMLKKRRKTVTALRIETEGERNDTPPKYFKTININFILTSPDTTEDELFKLVKLAVEKYCSVASSLDGNVSIGFMAEVIEG